jgi:hypothetical protein
MFGRISGFRSKAFEKYCVQYLTREKYYGLISSFNRNFRLTTYLPYFFFFFI